MPDFRLGTLKVARSTLLRCIPLGALLTTLNRGEIELPDEAARSALDRAAECYDEASGYERVSAIQGDYQALLSVLDWGTRRHCRLLASLARKSTHNVVGDILLVEGFVFSKIAWAAVTPPTLYTSAASARFASVGHADSEIRTLLS